MSTEQEIMAAQDVAIGEFADVATRISQRIAKIVGEEVAAAADHGIEVRVSSDVLAGSESHHLTLWGTRTNGEYSVIDNFQVIIRPRTQAWRKLPGRQ